MATPEVQALIDAADLLSSGVDELFWDPYAENRTSDGLDVLSNDRRQDLLELLLGWRAALKKFKAQDAAGPSTTTGSPLPQEHEATSTSGVPR